MTAQNPGGRIRKSALAITASAVIFSLAGVAGCGRDKNNSDGITDQAELARIVIEDKTGFFATQALCKITNQTVLADLAIRHVGLAGFEKLTNSALLAKVAFKADVEETRIEAFHAVDDIKILTELSATAADPATCRYAFLLLNIHNACQEIPEEHRSRLSGELLGLVGELLDPSVARELGDVQEIMVKWESQSQNYTEHYTKTVVVKGETVTVSAKLRDVLISHTWSTKFPDRIEFYQNKSFITGGIYPEVFYDKFLALLSASALTEVALKSEMTKLRCSAVRKLTDQALLTKIVVEDKNWRVRRAAVWPLTDQALRAKIAVEDENPDVRYAAMQRITDQVLLAKMAIEDKAWDVRYAAAEKLTDQTLLAKIAEDKDSDVRLSAVAKLTDQTLLHKLATGTDYEVKNNANSRLLELQATPSVK